MGKIHLVIRKSCVLVLQGLITVQKNIVQCSLINLCFFDFPFLVRENVYNLVENTTKCRKVMQNTDLK